MGESASRSCQACWDPEGTAAIVRKKKAQRAAINKYTELLDAIEKGTSGDGDLRRYDQEVRNKPANFYENLQQHDDWAAIRERRRQLRVE